VRIRIAARCRRGRIAGVSRLLATTNRRRREMATYLYRLGGWAYRRRRRVLAAWILVVALVGAAAATFGGQTDNSFTVPGTESQRAQDLLEKKFPGAGGASARVVYKAPEGERSTTRATAPRSWRASSAPVMPTR
jgi:RND superfamily putative drug exporter